jgi:hypothetical protein
MGVGAEKQRAVDALPAAVGADRLGDGEDVVLVEAAVERGAAMPGRAERNPLCGILRIGLRLPVGIQLLADVHQVAGLCRHACARVDPGAHQRGVLVLR